MPNGAGLSDDEEVGGVGVETDGGTVKSAMSVVEDAFTLGAAEGDNGAFVGEDSFALPFVFAFMFAVFASLLALILLVSFAKVFVVVASIGMIGSIPCCIDAAAAAAAAASCGLAELKNEAISSGERNAFIM